MKGTIKISAEEKDGRTEICIEADKLKANKGEGFILVKAILNALEFNELDKTVLAMALATGRWPQDMKGSGLDYQEIRVDGEAIRQAKEDMNHD